MNFNAENALGTAEELTAALEDFLHEARVFNGRMQASAQTISRGVKGDKVDKQNLEYHAQVLLDQAALLSLWMDLIQLDLNPEGFSDERHYPEKIHGKFYKAEIGLRPAARKKNIKIKLSGDEICTIDAYPVIDILPYIILENAIKYSPPHSSVYVDLMSDERHVIANVSSMGPKLEKGEAERIFERGFRSANPFVQRTAGQGKGLYFAKFICEIHGGDITYRGGSTSILFDGESFCEFGIEFRLPRSGSFM